MLIRGQTFFEKSVAADDRFVRDDEGTEVTVALDDETFVEAHPPSFYSSEPTWLSGAQPAGDFPPAGGSHQRERLAAGARGWSW